MLYYSIYPEDLLLLAIAIKIFYQIAVWIQLFKFIKWIGKTVKLIAKERLFVWSKSGELRTTVTIPYLSFKFSRFKFSNMYQFMKSNRGILKVVIFHLPYNCQVLHFHTFTFQMFSIFLWNRHQVILKHVTYSTIA